MCGIFLNIGVKMAVIGRSFCQEKVGVIATVRSLTEFEFKFPLLIYI